MHDAVFYGLYYLEEHHLWNKNFARTIIKGLSFFSMQTHFIFFSMQSKELKLPWRLRFSLHIIKILLKPFVPLQ
jgi:hypothetical protein